MNPDTDNLCLPTTGCFYPPAKEETTTTQSTQNTESSENPTTLENTDEDDEEVEPSSVQQLVPTFLGLVLVAANLRIIM